MTGAANAAVLTFENIGLNSSEDIPQTYGDLGNLDLTYQSREAFGNSAPSYPYLLYWQDGYSDRTGVAYAPDTNVAEISFNAAPGYTGTISTAYFGTYTSDVSGSFAIYDSAWNVLWSHTESAIWDGGIGISPAVSFTGIAYLQWGADWNLGLDELVYSVEPTGSQPAPVPLPAGLPLLGGGLLAFAGLRRSRKRG
ncbi:VPLPA-CTERM sorting domain-containing protein [uncultured Paracoccus sp.]|uniref:VPLPA-CTERM sorting domain-containing protein n=1 Tax=uncultured Paracoccus sp. TaxID=189685 RepID=UPI0025F529C0|nr:VPLPA-CTERM sorting domain-containing protein [uncultured Paracoccus sp.]